MRALGLDIGERRIGVAVSDATGRIATPLAVLDAGDARALARLVEDYEADVVVIGLPLSLDGSEGPQARAVRAVGDELARRLPVPLRYFDERLSTAEATRAMASAGIDARKSRGKVDMVAASLILQAYLDAEGAERGDG